MNISKRKRRSLHIDFLISDTFELVSCEARFFYVILNQLADDDGFIDTSVLYLRNYPEKQKLIDELLEIEMLYKIKENIYLLRHWNLNNYLRSDRYTPTIYQEEKAKFVVDKDGVYIHISEKKEGETYRKERTSSVLKHRQRVMERYNYERLGDLPASFKWRIRPKFVGKLCPICKNVMTSTGRFIPTIQHNKPISKGGEHTLKNISIVCYQCNITLRNKETKFNNTAEVIKAWKEMHTKI